MAEFSENLKRIRESLGLDKVQAATRLAMTYQQYSTLEKKGHNPTLKTIERVASNFGVSVQRLVG
jgi:transcriptional regulator with XRE-family HTH domain